MVGESMGQLLVKASCDRLYSVAAILYTPEVLSIHRLKTLLRLIFPFKSVRRRPSGASITQQAVNSGDSPITPEKDSLIVYVDIVLISASPFFTLSILLFTLIYTYLYFCPL